MVRYAILYFLMFVIFLALVIGPTFVGRQPQIQTMTQKLTILPGLIQPAGQNNNDTKGTSKTGFGLGPGLGATNIFDNKANGQGGGAAITGGSGNSGGGGGGGEPNGLGGAGQTGFRRVFI